MQLIRTLVFVASQCSFDFRSQHIDALSRLQIDRFRQTFRSTSPSRPRRFFADRAGSTAGARLVNHVRHYTSLSRNSCSRRSLDVAARSYRRFSCSFGLCAILPVGEFELCAPRPPRLSDTKTFAPPYRAWPQHKDARGVDVRIVHPGTVSALVAFLSSRPGATAVDPPFSWAVNRPVSRSSFTPVLRQPLRLAGIVDSHWTLSPHGWHLGVSGSRSARLS